MLVDDAGITGEQGVPLNQLITVVEEPLPQHLVPVFDAPPLPPPATS
ncbi:hypothetical protein [Streptomyces tendae]